MSHAEPPSTASSDREPPIPHVRGTRDWMPEDCAALTDLERTVMERFVRAGYQPIRTPILEITELHERKSGAGIVSKLFELADGRPHRLCLRPELTASIVRAFIASEAPPPVPWRVCASGPVFRYERQPEPGRYREFTQAGVELLGAPGSVADAEILALAVEAIEAIGITDPIIRVGHTGLILEILERSGLPTSAVQAMIEHLSDAAAEGRSIRALESALERLSGWLRGPAEQEAEAVLSAVERGDQADPSVDRLFRQLVPHVTGRRTGQEIIRRLRRKWELGHSLEATLDQVRLRLHRLADLRGPASAVAEPLLDQFGELAPDSIRALTELIRHLGDHGIPAERIELDLSFGHGIGFYSQMIFEISAPTPSGPIAVCHGGRYDGLAQVLGSDRDPHGVGFAVGLERLFLALTSRNENRVEQDDRIVIRPEALEYLAAAVDLAKRLRSHGWTAIVETQLDLEAIRHQAPALRASRCVIVAGPLRKTESLIVHDFGRDKVKKVDVTTFFQEVLPVQGPGVAN